MRSAILGTACFTILLTRAALGGESNPWIGDYVRAREVAAKEGKPILLVFR